MKLSEHAETMAREGSTSHRPPIKGLTEEDLRSVYYYLLFPNVLVSLHPDYVMLHTLSPRAVDRTEVVCEWYFEPRDDGRRRASTRSDAVDFWDQVNREDWDICALNQRGLRNRDATAGRYTGQEDDVHDFDVMVAGRYLEALRAEVAS